MRAILDATTQLENFYIFPTIYDNQSLLDFLLKVNGGILLIKNPHRLKKNEADIVNQILKKSEICIDQKFGNVKINCAVWMVSSEAIAKPNNTKGGWKILSIQDFWPCSTSDCFDIVLDLCRINNIYKGVHTRFDFNYCNNLLQKMTRVFNEDGDDTLVKAQDPMMKSIVRSLSKNVRKVERKNMGEITRRNHQNTIFFLKKFYTKSRKNKQISIASLNSMRKIANASSILRTMANGMEKMYSFGKNGEVYLEVIDAVIAVMFNEKTSLNRHGPENVVFGGKITRFFMNQNQDLDIVEGIDDTPLYLEKSDKQFLKIYQDILDFIMNSSDFSYEC